MKTVCMTPSNRVPTGWSIYLHVSLDLICVLWGFPECLVELFAQDSTCLLFSISKHSTYSLLNCYTAPLRRRFLSFFAFVFSFILTNSSDFADSDGLVKHISVTVTFPEILRSSHHFRRCHRCHLHAVTASPRGVGSHAEVGAHFFPCQSALRKSKSQHSTPWKEESTFGHPFLPPLCEHSFPMGLLVDTGCVLRLMKLLKRPLNDRSRDIFVFQMYLHRYFRWFFDSFFFKICTSLYDRRFVKS